MTIPAKKLPKSDRLQSDGASMATHGEKKNCREVYTVPARSAINVLTQASLRIRPTDLCQAAEVDPDQLSDPYARIPLRQLVRLYEAAARLTKEQNFGLQVAARTDLRSFDIFGYIITNSATLEDALMHAVRYFSLWTNGAGFRMARDRSGMQFIWEYVDSGIEDCRQDSEMTLLTASKIGRLLVRRLLPREVHFQHKAPRNISEHRRLFGVPVHFRMAANRLIFDCASLSTPMRGADRELCDVLIRHAENLLANTTSRLSLSDRAENVLRRALRAGNAHVSTVAREMAMGVRTLQRRLRTHGYSYSSLLAKVRRELAEHHLQDSEMPVSEIAYLLGYAQPSEFHRAFRVWTGNTPRQYRRPTSS